jgi:hypothetical protein
MQYDTSEYPNDSSRPRKFDDTIRERVTEQYMDILQQNGESIRTGIQNLLITHESSLELNPVEVQLYDEIVADIDLNSYRLGIGYLENGRMLGATTETFKGVAKVTYLCSLGSLFAGIVLVESAPVLGPIFFCLLVGCLVTYSFFSLYQ